MKNNNLYLGILFCIALFFLISLDEIDAIPRGGKANKLSMMTGTRQTGRAGERFKPSVAGTAESHPEEEEDHSKWIVESLSLSPPFPFGRVFSLPNFESEGNAVISDNYVRLTPDRQSKAGSVFSLESSASREFEVMFEFSISGNGMNAYGDGMAFWVASFEHPAHRHPDRNNFGYVKRWYGLGIIVDTFDNNRDFAQPSLTAIWNDGSFDFHHDSDGLQSPQLGSCKLKENIRNRLSSSRIVATYSAAQNTIEIRIRFADGTWQKCIDTDLTLPEDFEFHVGASAQTGQIADNHDLVSIKFYDLASANVNSPGNPQLYHRGGHHHYEADMVDDDLDDGYIGESFLLSFILYITFGFIALCLLLFIYWYLRGRSNPRTNRRFSSPLPS